MATLTLNVPVKEEFLRGIDEVARSDVMSRDEVVNMAIDAYLNRKREMDEYFAFCDNYVMEHNYTKEEFLQDIKEYYAEVYGSEETRKRAETRT